MAQVESAVIVSYKYLPWMFGCRLQFKLKCCKVSDIHFRIEAFSLGFFAHRKQHTHPNTEEGLCHSCWFACLCIWECKSIQKLVSSCDIVTQNKFIWLLFIFNFRWTIQHHYTYMKHSNANAFRLDSVTLFDHLYTCFMCWTVIFEYNKVKIDATHNKSKGEENEFEFGQNYE